MKNMKELTQPNEYRTGGSAISRRHNALFAATVLISLSCAGMLLSAGLLRLKSISFDNQKAIAALESPKNTGTQTNELYMEGPVVYCADLGITCQTIPEFCENYYQLPAGIYILQVKEGTPAALQGVLPGDVLVSVNDAPLRYPATLQWVLDTAAEDTSVVLEFSRKGKRYHVYVTTEA